MSKSIRSCLIWVSSLALMLLAAFPIFPQTSIPVRQETMLTFVHDFLQVFYPELFNKNQRLSLCLTAPGNDPWLEIAGVYFTVTPAEVNPLRKLTSSHPQATDQIVLGGSIWLPPMEYGRIQEVHANSDAVHEHQLEALRQSVESHPEWSDIQIASALQQAGARCGPNDQEAFVNSLPLNKAERFLGKLKITSVKFGYPNRDHSGHFAASALNWTVQAEAVLPNGTHPRYAFTFEPFEGKLTDLVQSLDR
jgi:hypothetical protein